MKYNKKMIILFQFINIIKGKKYLENKILKNFFI